MKTDKIQELLNTVNNLSHEKKLLFDLDLLGDAALETSLINGYFENECSKAIRYFKKGDMVKVVNLYDTGMTNSINLIRECGLVMYISRHGKMDVEVKINGDTFHFNYYNLEYYINE